MTIALSSSPYGKLIKSGAGLQRGLKFACFGDSHATTYFAATLAYALYKYHPADIIYDHRGVFTSQSNNTIIANRGQCYATGGSNTTHLTTVQMPQFVTDVANGLTADIGVFSAPYNDSDITFASLQTSMTNVQSAIDTFFANGGMAVIILGVHGLNPAICQTWANYWRFKETTSAGRIRFFDGAAAVSAPADTAGTAWVWRGGTNVFGAMTADGTHLSGAGSRAQAAALWPILKDLCPRTFNWPIAYTTPAFDPTMPYGNLLGLNGNMNGTAGTLNSGFNTGIPGTGAGNLDRWNISSVNGPTITPTIGQTPDGFNECRLALSAGTQGGFIDASMQATITNPNNGVASRLYRCGFEVELVNVIGLTDIFIKPLANAGYVTPQVGGASGAAADGLPDNTSEVWKIYSLYPVPITSNNPTFQFQALFRGGVNQAGTIKIRKAWMCCVSE